MGHDSGYETKDGCGERTIRSGGGRAPEDFERVSEDIRVFFSGRGNTVQYRQRPGSLDIKRYGRGNVKVWKE